MDKPFAVPDSPITATCWDCGHTWRRGQSGAHSCVVKLQARLATERQAADAFARSLAERVKELEAKLDWHPVKPISSGPPDFSLDRDAFLAEEAEDQWLLYQEAADWAAVARYWEQMACGLEARIIQAEHVPGRVLAAVREGAEVRCAERIHALEAEVERLKAESGGWQWKDLRGYVVWHRHDGDLVELLHIPPDREGSVSRIEVNILPPWIDVSLAVDPNG